MHLFRPKTKKKKKIDAFIKGFIGIIINGCSDDAKNGVEMSIVHRIIDQINVPL